MSSPLNYKTLRALPLDQLPSELSALRLKLPDDTITDLLLNAIDRGSIPTTVFAAWLGICKSPLVVRQSLRQKSSVHVRHLGLAQLKRGLESVGWETFWEGLGGTAGLLDAFSDLSVQEVRTACKAISRSIGNEDVLRKRLKVTELFKGFYPNEFPDAVAKTSDTRPLTKFYQELVPSCTEELVEWIISKEQEGKWRHVREKELLKHHSRSLRKVSVRSIFEDFTMTEKDEDRLRKLSTGYPPQRAPLNETRETGFSSSMAFALQLLRQIISTRATHLDGKWILENLGRSLLRRAMSKRISWSTTQEIAALTMEYLQQNPSAAKEVTGNKRDLLHLVAICWSRRSNLFEAHLKQLMGIVFNQKTSLQDIDNILIGVPLSRRYALLRMCCQEAMGIDLDAGTKLSAIRGRIPTHLLNYLKPSDALDLFRRVREGRGDPGLVDFGPHSSVLSKQRSPEISEGNPDIHYLVLLQRNGMNKEAEDYAAEIIATQKKRTDTASNRERRADLALYVWAYASASGSLKLFSETVKWARRFVRDQLTASRLFSQYYDETYRLLSGFLGYDRSLPGLQELRERVELANEILMDLLEIACSAVREPHFQQHDWRKTLNLFTQVVKLRLDLSFPLQETLAVSHDEISSALWQETISMLLRVENILNDVDFAKLGPTTIHGIVDWTFVFSASSKTWRKHAWSFIDDLAKHRNDLWTKLRKTRKPDVLTLPTPFPRGLPVQSLLSRPTWNSIFPVELHNLTPYIFSRVEETLFIRPELALQPVMADKPMLQAIGPFVDSYDEALKMYIPTTCSKEDKAQRFKRVLDHALGPLSQQRLNHAEAVEHWLQFFHYHLPTAELRSEEEKVHWPLLPKLDDPLETQEWNPLDGQPVDVMLRKARNLSPVTYIDFCTISAKTLSSNPDMSSRVKLPVPRLPEKKQYGGTMWQYAVGPEAGEANALAALLYLDAKYGPGSGLLSAPFPSVDDIRYPCVYLDEAFLSSEEVDFRRAEAYACSSFAPLRLIHKVAVNLVERFSSAQRSSSELEWATIALVRALKESDKPILAFELALKIIIDHPNASSWHRTLFNDGFFKALPASDARECITRYADAIREKLDAVQSKMKAKLDQESSGQAESDESRASKLGKTPPEDQPHIKITTLKSLAQILNGSTYIGDEVSLGILSAFAQKVSHADVRASILKTFLSKLEVNRFDLWDTVIPALEAFIPIAGSLNEREPAGQLDSVTSEVEDGAKLPEIQLMASSTWEEESPILFAMLTFFDNLQGDQLLSLYMERIVFPLIRTLEEQTAKWTTAFLKKYAKNNNELLSTAIPSIPKGSQLSMMMLSKSGPESYRVRRFLLDKYVEYLVFRIDPPACIRRFNQSLRADPSLKSTPEVETWLKLYGNIQEDQWRTILPFNKAWRFETNITEGSSPYVTAQTYQQAFLRIFRILVLTDSPRFHRLDAYVSTISPCPLVENELYKKTYEEMIANVNSLRNHEWERNPKRSPAVLPDVFSWRLRVLVDLRDVSDRAQGHEEICRTLAQRVTSIIDEISTTMYHEKLDQLKSHVRGQKYSLLLAVYLGDISKTTLSWLTTSDLLRVVVAADIISGMKYQSMDDTLENRVKALLATWVAHENEEVRRIGIKVHDHLYGAGSEENLSWAFQSLKKIPSWTSDSGSSTED